jgi:RNA polymerase sigma-70 factor (ECF subfamily)
MVSAGPASEDRLGAMTDEEIVALLAAGHQDALQTLHRRLAPLVFHIARRSLEAPAAEEITQDVFLKVWQKASSFDPAKGSFRTWILRIAQRRVINELRDRTRRPKLDVGSEASLADVAAADPCPEDQMWAQFRKAAIQRAVSALPPEQGQALRLAFFQDLSHEQVARFLEVPLGTAKSRIRLALEKLNTPLAALVALLLAGLGIASYQSGQRRAALGRDEAALGMLTGSRMQALRLLPPGFQGDPEHGPHATYRAEPGNSVVVFTLSGLPAPPAGETYQLWRLAGGVWLELGALSPDAQGHGRLLLQVPDRLWPERLRLTRGPGGDPVPGAPVLAWAAPAGTSGPGQ